MTCTSLGFEGKVAFELRVSGAKAKIERMRLLEFDADSPDGTAAYEWPYRFGPVRDEEPGASTPRAGAGSRARAE